MSPPRHEVHLKTVLDEFVIDMCMMVEVKEQEVDVDLVERLAQCYIDAKADGDISHADYRRGSSLPIAG